MKKRVDVLLVEKKLVETRAKAQAKIMAGQVSANGKIIKKSGEILNYNSVIVVSKLHPDWVSRGAYKLIHAIKTFNIEIKNKKCLDIGASTGGFSQVLLKYGAKKIYSVDVGKNQIHEKLLKEKKIINLEKTNARYLDHEIIFDTIDLIVCDVSFISMKKVLIPCFSFLNKKNGTIIGLIKPQFEAKKNEIKRGGIVSNSLIHRRICEDFQNWFSKKYNMNILGITQSPIKGPKGNIEFLIGAKIN
tara:strand:+ start:91 stop:828 length:738 start_codon:yes stop_codon:yes gene_type:complete